MTRAADTAPGAVELKACPFCGTAMQRWIEVEDCGPDNSWTARLTCAECDADGPPAMYWHETQKDAEDAAVIAWNTRTPTPSVATGEIAEGLPVELRAYAKHLRTWTCDVEEFGAVRPLKDAIAEAATLIEQHVATIAELREALERARPYVANVVEAEGAKFNRRDLFAIDTTLNRSKRS